MSRKLCCTLTIVAALAAGLASSCDGGGAGPDAGAGSDAGTKADAATADAGPGQDAGTPDTGGYVDERGFSIRIPQLRTVPMESFDGQSGTTELRDLDYVCTFKYGGEEGFLYVQSDGVASRQMAGTEYAARAAFWSFGKVVTPAPGTEYDYGGNHHNDSIDLTRGGKKLRYYHSSFGFGWRSCMAPDCLQVLDGTTVVEDGCTTERKLPVWCERVADDGALKPLVDGYKKCLGDPNAPDAGGGG